VTFSVADTYLNGIKVHSSKICCKSTFQRMKVETKQRKWGKPTKSFQVTHKQVNTDVEPAYLGYDLTTLDVCNLFNAVPKIISNICSFEKCQKLLTLYY